MNAWGVVFIVAGLLVAVLSIDPVFRYVVEKRRWWRMILMAYKLNRSDDVADIRKAVPCHACRNRGSFHFRNRRGETLDATELETVAGLITKIDPGNEDIDLLHGSVMFKRRNRPAEVCFRPVKVPREFHVSVILKTGGELQ